MSRALSIVSLLTLACAARAQRPLDPHVHDVRAHGATGRKADRATAAIQRAIDAAAAAGGGTVYFPPGDYLSGTIRLRSHVTLHLDAGATLWGSRDERDYPPVGAGARALIVAEDVAQIGIRGKGRIHGQAQRVYREARGTDDFIAAEIENARASGVEMKRWYHVPPVVRGVHIRRATGVTIEGVSILEAPAWLLHLEASDRVFIRGVHLASSLEAGVNADGIDVDGCRNVVISDVVIETGDDAIVLKSSRAGGESRPTENVTVTNCVVTSTSAGLKIGTETFGDFRNITFDNCVVRNTNRGLAIIVRDGGTVEDVLFSNITVETNRKHWNWWGNGEALWLTLQRRRPDSRLGRIRDVRFTNVIARSQGTSRLDGYVGPGGETRPLEEIALANVRLEMAPEGKPDKRATHALEARQVNGLRLQGVEVRWRDEAPEPRWGSALVLRDVRELFLEGFVGRHGLVGGSAPAVHLVNVRDGVVRGVEARPGTGTLLQIDGGGNVRTEAVDLLRRAREAVKIR